MTQLKAQLELGFSHPTIPFPFQPQSLTHSPCISSSPCPGPLPLSLLVSVSIDTSVRRSLCLCEVTRPVRLFRWLLSLIFVPRPSPAISQFFLALEHIPQNSFFLSGLSLHSIRLIISHHFMLSASASHWLLNHQATPNPTLRLNIHTRGHLNTHRLQCSYFSTQRLFTVVCPQTAPLTYSMYALRWCLHNAHLI